MFAKRFVPGVILMFVLGLALAPVALATSSRTSPCGGCHGGPNVAVTATLVSNNGSTATYSASAPGADVIAVFYGSTKSAQVNGPSGQFTVPTGRLYTLFAVAGPDTGDGIGSTSVSPVAPPVDTTAPTTVCDVKATYVSAAAIKLTATDAGSGVAATYFRLDGGAQTAGTTIATMAPGNHTLEYWSVDKAGNTEAHKAASFTITVPQPPADTAAPSTVCDAKATYVSAAAITLTATDDDSGVAATIFRLDGGPENIGTAIATTSLGAHTIEYWSVDVAGNVEAHKRASFNVTAPQPPADTMPPSTVCDAKATYVSAAAIKLTATDAGSGVAATYFRLDGGAQTAGTAIATASLGAHTIEFWSVDKAGNVEARKTATFTVTASDSKPVVVPSSLTISSARRAHKKERFSVSGKLTPGTRGDVISVYVMKPGASTWTLVSRTAAERAARSKHASWAIRYRGTSRGTYRFRAEFAGTNAVAPSTSKTITVKVH